MTLAAANWGCLACLSFTVITGTTASWSEAPPWKYSRPLRYGAMLRGPPSLEKSPRMPAFSAGRAKLSASGSPSPSRARSCTTIQVARGLGADVACFGMGVEHEPVVGGDHHVGEARLLQLVDRNADRLQ